MLRRYSTESLTEMRMLILMIRRSMLSDVGWIVDGSKFDKE